MISLTNMSTMKPETKTNKKDNLVRTRFVSVPHTHIRPQIAATSFSFQGSKTVVQESLVILLDIYTLKTKTCTSLTSSLLKYISESSLSERTNLLFKNCLLFLPFFHKVPS